MKRLLSFVAALFLAACASTPSLPSQLDTAFATVEATVQVTTQSLERGRITPEQAAKVSVNAKKAKETLDIARVALASCLPDKPCTKYTDLMIAVQPSLLELERELRAQQAKESKK